MVDVILYLQSAETFIGLYSVQVNVIRHDVPDNWKTLGGIANPDSNYPVKEDNGCTYWYQMMYCHRYGRFLDAPVQDKVWFSHIY